MGEDLEFLTDTLEKKYAQKDYAHGKVAGEPQYIVVVYGPEGMLDDTKKALEKFGGGDVILARDLDVMKRLIREPSVDCAVYHAIMERDNPREAEVLALNNIVGKPVIRAMLLEYGCLTYDPEQIAAERDNFERELKEALEGVKRELEIAKKE